MILGTSQDPVLACTR